MADREIGLNSIINYGGNGMIGVARSRGHHDVDVQANDGVLLHRVYRPLPSRRTLLRNICSTILFKISRLPPQVPPFPATLQRGPWHRPSQGFARSSSPPGLRHRFFLQIVVFAIMVDDVILFGRRMMWCWPISSWSRPPICLSQTWTYFLWSGGQDQQPSIYTIMFWLQCCGIYIIMFDNNVLVFIQ